MSTAEESLHYCRLCVGCSNLISMFSGKSRKCRDYFRKMIQESLGISIEQEDVTTTVCLNCLLDVTYFQFFKLHCLQNEDKLKILEITSSPKPKKSKCHASPLKTLPVPDIVKTEEAFNWLKVKRSNIEPIKESQSFSEQSTQTILDCECKSTQVEQIQTHSSGNQTNFAKFLKNRTSQTTALNNKNVYCQTLQKALQLKVFNDSYMADERHVKDSSVQTEQEKEELRNSGSNSSFVMRSLPLKKRTERIVNSEENFDEVKHRRSEAPLKPTRKSFNKTDNVVQATIENNRNETVLKWLAETKSNGAIIHSTKEIEASSLVQVPKDELGSISTPKSETKETPKKITLRRDLRSLFSPDTPQTSTGKRKNGTVKPNINHSKKISPSLTSNCDISKAIALESSLTPSDETKEEKLINEIKPSPLSTAISPGSVTGLLQVNPTKSDRVEICGLCGKTLYNKREIKVHEKAHTRCHICKKKLKTVEAMTIHLNWCKVKGEAKEQPGACIDLVKIDEMEGVRKKYPKAFEELVQAGSSKSK